jgi:hypothetical protein
VRFLGVVLAEAALCWAPCLDGLLGTSCGVCYL